MPDLFLLEIETGGGGADRLEIGKWKFMKVCESLLGHYYGTGS